MKQTNFDAKRHPCLSALLAVLLAWPLGLLAQDDVQDEVQGVDDAADSDAAPSWYLGVLGGYVVPDSARDAQQGINLHGILGIVLTDSLALELNIFGQQMERTDGRNDYSNGGGLDLVLGTPAPGNPFFMIGGGSIHEDLRTTIRRGAAEPGYEDNSGYANAGLGLYLPFSMAGELWRLEGRYNVVFNNETERSDGFFDDFFEDVRINLGVVFPFGREQPPPPVVVPPPPPPPPSVPPPPPADADEDGVVDELDQCPGTPRWVRADAAGCTPDSDGDGVDETRDCCPSTPAGKAVDSQGCEPKPPAPATLQPPPDTDTDNDGVVDRLDVCPHTVSGYEVDASGCVKIQNVVIKSVHFELNSDALTPDAYLVLNSVAASFKAQPRVVMEVAGHADSIGSSSYNLALSQRRAAVVRDFLIFSGVHPEQLVSAGYGETRPLGDNKTEEGRALNRRVEFRMLGK